MQQLLPLNKNFSSVYFMQKTSPKFSLVVAIALICAAFTPSYAEIETSAEYAYMVDANTGTVLLDKRAGESMNPSSMSKLMTIYLLFEDLKAGNLQLDSTFKVSEKAWQKGGSKMFVQLGSEVAVEDLIRGIIVQSGNDACIVVAEGLAGNEEAFAVRMNETAEKLGLKESHFMNATGWPDPEHYMSAKDIALLAKAIIRDFPEYYPYYSETEYTYNGITQHNRNRLLGKGLGVDGLKTGHTEVAGYGIALSARDEANGRRVVLVINGLDSDEARVNEGAKLLSYGLKAFENKSIVIKDQKVGSLPVWFGAADEVALTAGEDVELTLPKGSAGEYTASIKANAPLESPVKKGAEVATLQIKLADGQTIEVPLVAANDIEKSSGMRWMKQFFYQHLLGVRD